MPQWTWAIPIKKVTFLMPPHTLQHLPGGDKKQMVWDKICCIKVRNHVSERYKHDPIWCGLAGNSSQSLASWNPYVNKPQLEYQLYLPWVRFVTISYFWCTITGTCCIWYSTWQQLYSCDWNTFISGRYDDNTLALISPRILLARTNSCR